MSVSPPVEALDFEGSEKRLELHCAEPATALGLMLIEKQQWSELLSHAKCTILSESTVRGSCVAYVLSESSLFVFRDYVIFKTCGTTPLLHILKPLLNLLRAHRLIPTHIRYSRCEFLFPQEQCACHRSFECETKLLRKYFTGEACVLSPSNEPQKQQQQQQQQHPQ